MKAAGLSERRSRMTQQQKQVKQTQALSATEAVLGFAQHLG